MMGDGEMLMSCFAAGQPDKDSRAVKRVRFAKDDKGDEAYVVEIEFRDSVFVSAKEIAQFIYILNREFKGIKPSSGDE